MTDTTTPAGMTTPQTICDLREPIVELEAKGWYEDAHGEVVLMSDATDALELVLDRLEAAERAAREAIEAGIEDADTLPTRTSNALAALDRALSQPHSAEGGRDE